MGPPPQQGGQSACTEKVDADSAATGSMEVEADSALKKEAEGKAGAAAFS